MTIYSDGQGNFFFGDIHYANHDPAYPLNSYMKSDSTWATLSQDVTDLLTAAGMPFRDVASQTFLDDLADGTVNNNLCLVRYGTDVVGDIDDRYCMRFVVPFSSTNTSLRTGVTVYSDLGDTGTSENTFTDTNLRFGSYNSSSNVSRGLRFQYGDDTTNQYVSEVFTDVQTAGFANGKVFGLFLYQYLRKPDLNRYMWCYGGRMKNVNTNENLYDRTFVSQSIALSVIHEFSYYNNGGAVDLFGTTSAKHYRSELELDVLQVDDAEYAFVCSDAQTPSGNFTSDVVFFDDNTDIGNPGMGMGDGLLLATATGLEVGKPYKITGGTLPGTGQDVWLPVANYADKMLFQRIYSTH